MKELLEQLRLRFEEKQKLIISQQHLITELKKDDQYLKKEIAMKEGQILELNAKWNKMQKLIKGVQ